MEQNNFYKFVNELTKFNDRLTIKFKNESSFMKLLGRILFFNKSFMTTFTTTIGNTIYFPNEDYINGSNGGIVTVAHEYMHTQDNKRLGFLYNILYLFPQILFLCCIPLLFLCGVWALLCLVFLLPLPAYGRMKLELNGYTMTLFAINELYKQDEISLDRRTILLSNRVDGINKQFTGSAYYFMWPFGVKKQLEKNLTLILSENMLKENKVFAQVRMALLETNKNG